MTNTLNDTIRAVFLAHGFTIKDGQTDLKPYVYEAVHALLSKLRAPVADTQGDTDDRMAGQAPENHNCADGAGSGGNAGATDLLAVAKRNLRTFISSIAKFRCEADRTAALNCLDVLLVSAPVAEVQIGVGVTEQGATVCLMQPHADGSATVIYSETHPIGDSVGRAALASAPVAGEAVALELRGVPETIKGGDGFWRSCTGCHELNEGHDTGPYSAILRCHLGNGCSECGGIGAIWDSTDYQAMADDMARSMGQSVDAAPQASEAVRDAEDAARWRWATASDGNADKLCSIVLCHGGYQDKINERADFYRAALSAQPGAQRTGGSDV